MKAHKIAIVRRDTQRSNLPRNRSLSATIDNEDFLLYNFLRGIPLSDLQKLSSS